MVSILDSIKELHGINSADTSFDPALIMHINGALMVMTQLGVGPLGGFSITSKDDTWAQFLGNRTDLDLVKSDVYCRVRLVFDPPMNAFVVTAIEKQIIEYDWRIEAWHDPNMSNIPLYVPVPVINDDDDPFYD